MGILQAQGINLSFGDRTLLSDVSFTLSEKCRAALCGGNGEGKSTLLKIVAGRMNADSGQINKTRGMKISYLPQSDIVFKDSTVYEEIEKAFTDYREASERQKEIENQLENNPSDKNLLAELEVIHNILFDQEAFNHKAKIHTIAKGLGFKTTDMDRLCSEFSGGYQMRIALSKMLASEPDVMLLDEPTNYLDIESRLWLQNYLKSFSGSLLIVCHDRDFLDSVVNEVYELFNSRLTRYSGNYSFYEKERISELERLEAAYQKQTAEIERTEDFIEKFRYKATKARQVQSRIRMLEKIERITLPGHLKKLRFTFPEPPHSPNDMVKIENLTKIYNEGDGENELKVFKDLNLYVGQGMRLAVTGHNGIGKSTLLRIIAGADKDYSGNVIVGNACKIGYFSQDGTESLNKENTILEEVLPFGSEGEMRNALGSFLFSGDDIYKKISVLSGGEKSRLLLLKILLRPANLLILDEPTNHLDINAKDMLLSALREYKGTLIFVSHDTYFIKGIADTILYLSDKGPELFSGDWDYFEWKLSQNVMGDENSSSYKSGLPDTRRVKQASVNNIPNSEQNHLNNQTKLEQASPKTQSKEERAEANRLKNKLNKSKREVNDLLLRVQTLEEEIAENKALLNQSEYYSDAEKANALLSKISSLEAERSSAEEEWLLKTEELESLQLP